MRVLLVEDDECIVKTLETALIRENYAVDVALDGEVGWRLIESFAYDLILLDVLLPKLDGITFCRQLRQHNYQTPVLLLTAQNSSTDRIAGLDAGADDYVAKPFELPELLARMRVLLRRSNAPVVSILEWENLQLDRTSCQVKYADQSLHLTPKEYRLLELMLRNPRHVFSRRSIIEHLWGLEDTPGEDTVTAHVKGLRQKLKQAGAPSDFVETVYGIGYRLKQDISCPKPKQNDLETFEAGQSNQIESKLLSNGRSAHKPANESKRVRAELETSWRNQETKRALQQVWKKYETHNRDRLRILEQAIRALKMGELSEELRQQARSAAHKLAGTLGVFGLPEGSRFALEIEDFFRSGAVSNAKKLQQLAQGLSTLRTQLHKPPSSPEITSKQSNPPLFIVDINISIGEPVELAAQKYQAQKNQIIEIARSLFMQIQWVSSLESAWSQITSIQSSNDSLSHAVPDALILPIALQTLSGETLALLTHLTSQLPPVPVLVFTEKIDLDWSVRLAQAGVHAIFPTCSPEQILQTAKRLRSPESFSSIHVMVVDDDPQILAMMRALLEPWGVQLTMLERSPQFWDVLNHQTPDVLILDVDMPEFTGIELCQAVRSVPQWQQLPILFLTVHTDADTLRQVFHAGADAVIGKPITDSEVVFRIFSELERAKLSNLT
jgi:DNA-binding response OmpR family regulator/HPt (histidine-containing phosphotransfer) domain-containing protein